MTNEELKKLSDETFFDNDTGEIQPAGHRNFNNHLIDHTDTLCEATLRNSKEYTDTREKAILAAADTKDADTLRTAKEYADKIVAALAGSAPETLDTLQELAAALGDDPNFAATVMQLIGEKATMEQVTDALDGKADKGGSFLESWRMAGLFAGSANNVLRGGTDNTGAYLELDTAESGGRTLAQLRLNKDGTLTFYDGRSRTVWHSGNFDPANCFLSDGRIESAVLNDPQAAMIGNKACVVPLVGIGGLLVSFSAPASASPLQFYLDRYHNASLKWRNGVDNDKMLEPEFRTIWDSGNMKPTYHAQINPNGQIVSQSADWIQSVQWVSNGNGYRCDIVPKVSVNTATVQVTAIVSGGNSWPDYRMPIVYDTLVNGAITVCIVGKDGASSQNWFNISVQGA